MYTGTSRQNQYHKNILLRRNAVHKILSLGMCM